MKNKYIFPFIICLLLSSFKIFAQADACASATNLGTVSTNTTVTGTIAGATADQTDPSCFIFNQNVWYKFTVPAGGGSYNVAISTTGGSGALLYPDVAVFSGSCGSFTELACNAYCGGDFSGTISYITLNATCLAAGTYYISVDDDYLGCDGTAGTFSLTLTQTSAGVGAPGNNACASATNLGSVSTTTTVTGNNNCATADQTDPSCFYFGRNVWYKFTVPAGGGSYQAIVANNGSAGTLQYPDVVIFSGACNGFTEKACNSGSGGYFSETISNVTVDANCLAAGTYYIAVDDDGSPSGFGTGSSGTFSLTVTQTNSGTSAPGNNACASATNLGSVSTSTTVAGTTACATGDQTDPSCFYFDENVWYKFTVPAGGGSYQVSVTGGSIINPDVVIFSGGCGAFTEKACNGNGAFDNTQPTPTYSSVAVNANCLAAGTYYVAVDDDGSSNGFGTGSPGSFSITVTQSSSGTAAPGNNACASATNLGTVSTTTTVAGNNNCASADQTAPACFDYIDNVWYKFTIPAGGGSYHISVACGTMVYPNVAVFSGACNGFSTVACNSQCGGDFTGTASAISVDANCLAAGTYYIAVDDDNNATGCGGSTGSFSLTVTQTGSGNAGPSNNACASAISLGTVSTTTTVAGNNLCATADQTSPVCMTYTNNVWYTFTVPAGGGNYQVTVNSGTMTYPNVAVFSGSCGAFTALQCNSQCNGDFTGTSSSITVYPTCLAAGTYYIAIDDDNASDGCGGSQGTFSVVVTQTSAGGPPTNDLCTAASSLTTGTVKAGTNVCATSAGDPSTTCENVGTNATVWYTYTPATSGSATFSVSTGTMTWPAVTVLTGTCGSFTEIGCASAATSGGTAVVTSGCLTAGVTYYIMVDNVTGNSGSTTGTFSIVATYTTVATGAPSNNCCTNPTQISTLDGTCLGGYTTTGATFDQYTGGCMTGTDNVWFSFVAQGTSATITITGAANFHPEVMIFKATNLCSSSGVTSYGCATSSGASVSVSNSTNLVAGNTYYVMVTNNSTGTAGSFSICINNPLVAPAPGQDCVTAMQVCNNSNLGGNAAGVGNVTDLTSSNESCLSTGEHESNWFVVNINTGGTLSFTLAPTASYDDYDYAIWGPFTSTAVACPPSGTPMTCNYSATTPNTGLTTASTHTNQGAGGTPWNAPINVITGDAYLMIIDNYSTITEPFSLNWGGTAILSCNSVIILAVQLLNFTAALHEDQVNVNWSTSSEVDNNYFTLERSPDGVTYTSLANIKGAGTSNTKRDYSYIDYEPLPGTSYYRLSQTDFNGVTKSLSVQPVTNTDNDGMFTVVPNPTDGVVNISYTCNTATSGVLKLINSSGTNVLTKDFTCTAGQNSSQLNLGDIAPGIYIITFNTNDKFYRTKLIKK